MEKLWNKIKGAFEVTFNTCRSFAKYDQLDHGDQAKSFDAILPSKKHPKCQQARAIFEQLDGVLRNYLI
eukprot:317259-Ditylum_brightwellii.AAC.1